MNTKITLSLDKDIIKHAKSYAKDQNISLSSLVENLLLKVISGYEGTSGNTGSIVKELSGIINLEGDDYKEEHKKYLEEYVKLGQ